MPQAEAVLIIEVSCDECHRKPKETAPLDVFLRMEPKLGTEAPFFLCVGCWLDRDGFDGPQARRDARVLVDDPKTAESPAGELGEPL